MIYVVKPGDTLLSIGRRFGVPTQDIARLNQLSEPGKLVEGQALLLLDAWPQGPWALLAGGYAYPGISPWLLEDCLENLTDLSVFSYGFRADGTLLAPARPVGALVERARRAGVSPALVLTPFGDNGRFDNTLITALLADPLAQRTLLAQIAGEMERVGYRELNLDFEFVRREDRAAYVTFVQRCKALLAREVTVCLAPKTSDDQPGLLYEGKDYRGLGEAADRVLLMTYEWGYTFGPPMAVAPLPKVRQVAEYALSRIPAEKLLLGLANYGYDWTLPYERGKSAARSLGNVEAVDLAREQGVTIQFDPEVQSPWFVYEQDGISHEVWFEDVRSWEGKLHLAVEYGLAGVGIWQLMRPFRAGLTLVSSRLRGTPRGMKWSDEF